MIPFRQLSWILFFTTAGCSLLLLSGCDTPPRRANPETSAGPRPIAMSGQSDFFDGKITASVTVSRGSGRPGTASGEGEARGGARRGGGRQRGGGADGGASTTESGPTYAGTIHPSSLPTVTIRLKLENNTDVPVDVEITEASSALGNFAVKPEKLTLAPRESKEPDPMFSQLGVTSDEIPVKVGLKISSMGETKAIAVRTIGNGDGATVAP